MFLHIAGKGVGDDHGAIERFVPVERIKFHSWCHVGLVYAIREQVPSPHVRHATYSLDCGMSPFWSRHIFVILWDVTCLFSEFCVVGITRGEQQCHGGVVLCRRGIAPMSPQA